MFDKTELEVILEALYGELAYMEEVENKIKAQPIKLLIAKIENFWRNNDY